MAQPQIDIMTPAGEAPADSGEGYKLFQDALKNINGSRSAFEGRLAVLFSQLPELGQQIWLKAAELPLLTQDLRRGGFRITAWSELNERQRQKMMIAYREMRKVVEVGEA